MEIREYTTYNETEILKLYASVGWTAYTKHPDVLRKADCAVMAFSGQAAGFFHKVCAGKDPAAAGAYYNTPENLRRAAELKKISETTGLSLSALLLKYLLQAETLQIIPLVRGVDREQLERILETLDDTQVDFGDLRDFE